jgi:hypothetical protein
MSFVLLVLGLLATAAGFITIGFGIPINAFSLGNTLIISGTIAVAAGLILIGIAATIGQLRRIAEALQPHGHRPAESIEAFVPPSALLDPAVVQGSLRKPETSDSYAPSMRAPEPDRLDLEQAGLRHAAPRHGMPGQSEPRFPAAAATNAPPGSLKWLRAKSAATAQSMDEAPTSSPAGYAIAPSPQPAEQSDEALPAARAQQPPPRPDETIRRPPAAVAEQPREKANVELVWPNRTVSAPAVEPAKREPDAGMPPPPIPLRPHDRRDDKRVNEKRADVAPRPQSAPVPNTSAAAPEPERGLGILKSGVIDGMPYTLYTNGSIEAQLPHGTVRFASVDALRAHLEKPS